MQRALFDMVAVDCPVRQFRPDMFVVAIAHMDKGFALSEAHFPGIRERGIKKGVRVSSERHFVTLARRGTNA